MTLTGSAPRTLQEWLQFGRKYLREHQIRDAETDAWLLLEAVLHYSRSRFYLLANEELPSSKAAEYRNLLEKRAAHCPLQQLTGEAWFFGRTFAVDERVLTPRQDTEILVEEALKRLQPGQRILDLCTGSGCILLTLCAEMDVEGIGTDLSADALAVAAANRERLGLSAVLLQGDLLAPVTGSFDMILSNPPYIPTEVIETLDPEVRDHEPRMALDGKEDGLFFYRRIFREAPAFLKEDGWLGVEIGYDQGADCCCLLEEAGYRQITLQQDLAGLDRVIFARCPMEQAEKDKGKA